VDEAKLRQRVRDIERGGIVRAIGCAISSRVTFRRTVSHVDARDAGAIRGLREAVDDYGPGEIGGARPELTRASSKGLYQ